jgi:hypothetical protein
VGFVTDYANEVMPGEPTPVSTLTELMGSSSEVFSDVLVEAVRRLDAADRAPTPAGIMLRLGQPG